MQTAKLTLKTCAENEQVKYDVTPAEALILSKMHFKGAAGSPLKDVVVTGEAKTVEFAAKSEIPAFFDHIRKTTVDAVPAVPEVAHARTQAEEIERLKRKYTGNIKVEGGKSLPAFTATFGTARVVLPQTFKEVEEELGLVGMIQYPAPVQETEEEAEQPEEPTPAPAPKRSRKPAPVQETE